MIRAALYIRISGASQDAGMQGDELRSVAQLRGWVVVGEYNDVVTGSRERRPGLDRLVADVEARRVDVVAVWKLDRLGRSLKHLLHLAELFATHGAGLVSLRDPGVDTTTATGRLVFQVLGAAAEFERALIQERATAGRARARARGVHLGRRRVITVTPEQAAFAVQFYGSQRAAAFALRISPSTLRRILDGSGAPKVPPTAPQDKGLST